MGGWCVEWEVGAVGGGEWEVGAVNSWDLPYLVANTYG